MTPQEARKLWTDALRSGEYEQGKFSLCKVSPIRGESYCCLGVACEVYQKHIGGLTIHQYDSVRTYQGSAVSLPGIVAEWLDITTCGSMETEDWDGSRSLVNLNDWKGLTFSDIADVIGSPESTLYPYGQAA